MAKNIKPNKRKTPANQTKTEVVEVIGVNISDQIAGQWYPSGSVKKGTRWFYIVQLIFALLVVAFGVVAAAMALFYNDSPTNPPAQDHPSVQEELDSWKITGHDSD